MPKCLMVYPSIFLAIDTTGGALVTFPIVYQIDRAETADWLLVTPGLFNNAGGRGDYEIDIIEGSPAPAAAVSPIAGDAANYPANNLNIAPVASVPSGQQALIPWGKRLQFAIVLRSDVANIPAGGSRLALTLQPFST